MLGENVNKQIKQIVSLKIILSPREKKRDTIYFPRSFYFLFLQNICLNMIFSQITFAILTFSHFHTASAEAEDRDPELSRFIRSKNTRWDRMEFVEKVRDMEDEDREALYEEFKEISNMLWVNNLHEII